MLLQKTPMRNARQQKVCPFGMNWVGLLVVCPGSLWCEQPQCAGQGDEDGGQGKVKAADAAASKNKRKGIPQPLAPLHRSLMLPVCTLHKLAGLCIKSSCAVFQTCGTEMDLTMSIGDFSGGDHVEQETPSYDKTELRSLLESGFRGGLKKALNEFEPLMDDTLQHVGKLIDGRIKKVNSQLKVRSIGSLVMAVLAPVTWLLRIFAHKKYKHMDQVTAQAQIAWDSRQCALDKHSSIAQTYARTFHTLQR